MGISKLYQFFLFVLLLGVIGLVIAFERSELDNQGTKQLELYQQVVTKYTDWDGSGEALFKSLSPQVDFQFFQFIHDIDSEVNFTQGEISPASDSVLSALFPLNLNDTRKLQHGRLQVKLSEAQAVDEAIHATSLAIIVAVVIYVFLSISFALIIMRQKRSIRYAAQYIESIPKLQYTPVEASKLKGELRPLASALNECRLKLKQALDEITHENEKLNRVAYQDPVTGFGSRPRFTQKLDALRKDAKAQFGSLVMIKATELGNINQALGRIAGDDYLAKVGSCIRKSLAQYPDADCYRISSADFVSFIPNLVWQDGEKYLETLKAQLDEYQQIVKTESVAHIGFVPYKNGDDPITLITLADTAVSIAQTMGPNYYHSLNKLSEDDQGGDDRWKLAVDDIIKRRAIKFYQQPISACRKDIPVYRELLSRFYNNEGKVLPTATVIAMAERHGLMAELDKLVIVTTLRMLKENPNLDGNFGVNISPSSALNESFVAWLKDLFTKQGHLAQRLVLEVNEAGMQANVNACYKFVKEVHSTGSRVSIERFGLGFTSFKFFREVRPDYIKLDGSYTSGIDEDKDNKFFVRMMVDVARKIGIRVIATSVERQEEKLALEELLVDALQGFYIAQPQAMSPTEKQ